MSNAGRKKRNKVFPWKELHPGQAFFLPCLDPEPLAAAGMKAAFDQGVYDTYCSAGLYNNRFGVMFGRLPAPKNVINYIIGK